MTWFAVGATVIWAVLLCLITVVQTLYMESLRLRSRDLPALQFFKDDSGRSHRREGRRRRAGVFAHQAHAGGAAGRLFPGHAHGRSRAAWQNLFEAALFAWLTMLISTYVLAQVLYRKTSGRWLLPLAPILRLCALLVRPLTAILGFFQSLVELSEPAKANEEGPGPAGDIEALISAGEEEGIIEKDDRKLIESVVAFGDKTVREVMTPRPKMVAIEANRSLEDLRELVIHEQYSRIPVYERTIDNIIGFVHVRDMFELDEADRQGRRVKELTRPIRFVPETKPVNDLLREMQQDGAHMAIVIDEYGNTAGLATMEDMVEEILGEIHDEHEPERDVLKQPRRQLRGGGQPGSGPFARSAGVPAAGRNRIHHHRRPGDGMAGARPAYRRGDRARWHPAGGAGRRRVESGAGARLESGARNRAGEPLMSDTHS